MTTAELLQGIVAAKESTRQAIIAKGVDVAADAKLSEYADKVAAIEQGGKEYKYSIIINPDKKEFRVCANVDTGISSYIYYSAAYWKTLKGYTMYINVPFSGSLSNMCNYGVQNAAGTIQRVVIADGCFNKVNNLESVFNNFHKSLESFDWGVQNLSRVTSLAGIFNNRSAFDLLTEMKGTLSDIKPNVDIKTLTAIDRDGAMVFINGLYSYTDGAEHTLTLAPAVKGLLSDADINIATSKGWTIA